MLLQIRSQFEGPGTRFKGLSERCELNGEAKD